MLPKLRFRRDRYPLRQRGTTLPCNLCGGEDFVVVGTRDRYLKRLINVMCRGCGLVFQNPMATDEELHSYYRHRFWQASQGQSEPKPKQMVRDIRYATTRLNVAATVAKPGARILDVGSGSGAYLGKAKEAGFVVEGIEPSLGYARFSERTFGVTVHPEPLSAIDFGERRFDLISCNHALEHMRDPLGALLRFHALLEPGGYLDLAVPHVLEPGKSPLRALHAGHLFGFTPETLTMMAAKAGFAPVARCGTAWFLFRRLPAPDPDWLRYPGHAAENEVMFRQRTFVRYLLNANTFRRIPGKMRRWLSDFRAARARANGRSPVEHRHRPDR
jgi:2-polyprenyl-3-methyl-5-hydroxy-6-metoxy-1,4-benzoquinol methylase